MKSFLKKILYFIVPITIILMSGLFLPPTPRASKSFVFSDIQKDSLLEHTKDPRILFVGGSNLSFGLNSSIVKDSLRLNPVNTAVNVGLGLKYMFGNTSRFIKKGDIIILSPEYELFYKPYDAVSDELLRTIYDVAPQKSHFLSLKQKLMLLEFVPKFSLTKFDPTEYWGYKESDVYSVNSYNEYGDVSAHWSLERRMMKTTPVDGDFNEEVLKEIQRFEDFAKAKGASVYIMYPCLNKASFELSKEKILHVEKRLKEYRFNILGDAETYVMPEDVMFNTKYHLTKQGLDLRTRLFIAEFKKARSVKPL